MNDFVYFQGQIVPPEEAHISVKTHAFLYGTSLFEGVRGYWLPEANSVSLFRLKEHYQRILANSRIFFMLPEDSPSEETLLQQWTEATCELVKKNAPQQDFYIRLTLYKSGISIGPCLDNSKTDVCIWTQPLGNYVNVDDGLHVTISSWRRVDDNAIPPCAKAAGAYMNSAVMVTDAKRNGFDEVITLTHNGTVSEGSAMNIFMVRRSKLVTPPVTDNILEGITRDSIIELATRLGIEVEQRSIGRTELYRAEEVFFTGTAAQIAPVTRIDHRPVGNGKPGEMTKRVQQLYADVVHHRRPEYAHWCTLVPITTGVAGTKR